ncbi:MAG: 50S ribosomal protein L10 [Patescibacteria group bacterium]
MLNKAQKGELVQELTEKMKSAKTIVFADYQGVSVKDLSVLRAQMRKEGITFQVAKKSLMKIAAKENGYADIPNDVLEGPVGAAFSMDDEVAAARIINTFAKKNKNLKLRGALFNGRILGISETKALAMLPSKMELIAKFMYMVKYPLQGFHDVLNNTIGGFVRVLGAVKDKKSV